MVKVKSSNRTWRTGAPTVIMPSSKLSKSWHRSSSSSIISKRNGSETHYQNNRSHYQLQSCSTRTSSSDVKRIINTSSKPAREGNNATTCTTLLLNSKNRNKYHYNRGSNSNNKIIKDEVVVKQRSINNHNSYSHDGGSKNENETGGNGTAAKKSENENENSSESVRSDIDCRNDGNNVNNNNNEDNDCNDLCTATRLLSTSMPPTKVVKVIDAVSPNIRNQFSIARKCDNTPSILASASTLRRPFTKMAWSRKKEQVEVVTKKIEVATTRYEENSGKENEISTTGKRQHKYLNNGDETSTTPLNRKNNSNTNADTMMKVGTNALVLRADKCITTVKEGGRGRIDNGAINDNETMTGKREGKSNSWNRNYIPEVSSSPQGRGGHEKSRGWNREEVQHFKIPPKTEVRLDAPRRQKAKRIRLNENRTINNSNNEDEVKDSEVDCSSTPKSTPTSKTGGLTNFVYRETSLKRSITAVGAPSRNYSKNKKNCNDTGPNKNIPTKINRGLVRVKPDLSKTPICRTYVRGIRCDDPYCTYRHDIPHEYGIPVCSFFQKHGQCLRMNSEEGDNGGVGKCPFRHVKINAGATICPSFRILGFCEDTDCKMRHVNGVGGPKKARGKG